MTNQLTTIGNGALSAFGARDDVKEIGQRLQKMMPGTESFTENEALTVAQIAVAHGLDPFNGEVWGIKGNGKWYGVMVGIKGLRKAARRQMQEQDGSFWTEFFHVLPEKYHVKTKDAIVYECVIRDTITTQAWAKSIHAMTTAGVPYPDAIAALGKAPYVLGVGIADPSERSKMDLHARAKKRAEADAIKQRFDVEFGGASYSPEYVDYEPEIIQPDNFNQAPRDSKELLAELGYAAEPEFVDAEIVEDPGWNPAEVAKQEILNDASNKYKDRSLTEKQGKLFPIVWRSLFDDNEDRHAVAEWLFGVTSTQDIEDRQALAIMSWMKLEKEAGTGNFVPSSEALTITKSMITLARKAYGQAELGL